MIEFTSYSPGFWSRQVVQIDDTKNEFLNHLLRRIQAYDGLYAREAEFNDLKLKRAGNVIRVWLITYDKNGIAHHAPIDQLFNGSIYIATDKEALYPVKRFVFLSFSDKVKIKQAQKHKFFDLEIIGIEALTGTDICHSCVVREDGWVEFIESDRNVVRLKI